MFPKPNAKEADVSVTQPWLLTLQPDLKTPRIIFMVFSDFPEWGLMSVGVTERVWDSRDSRPFSRARFEHGVKVYIAVVLGKPPDLPRQLLCILQIMT